MARDIAKTSSSSRELRLLLKAIRSLPEREQDIVLAYLLERSPAVDVAAGGGDRPRVASQPEPSGAPAGAIYTALSTRAALPAAPASMYFGAGAQGALRTMPVRFPEEQYRRLKDWCTEHNFPMAVVVRGLVERFLDEQERPGRRPAPAA